MQHLKSSLGIFALLVSVSVIAHPGGGIVALSEKSALVADPTENFIWLVEKGQTPKPLVRAFHGHWMTRGRDGGIYTEAFQESGGAWSSAAFRLDLPTGKLTELAHRDQLRALAFAVEQKDTFIVQRGEALVSWKDGKEAPFRLASGQPKLREVTAYAWSPEGDLLFADRDRVFRLNTEGAASLIGQINGKPLTPKIWNGTDTPVVFGLAADRAGATLAAVPSLAIVFRLSEQKSEEFARGQDGWRATGVSVFGDTVFLMESDSRASTSPRVRIIRGGADDALLTLPPRAK